jgi:S-layer protein
MFAGGTVSKADTDAAIDYIAGAITAGTFTKTSAVVALTSYMASADGAANATYGSVSQAYQNKVEVAEYYTITKGLGDATAAERKAAIAGVTDAAASVTSSNEASDATATVVTTVPSTTLTLTTGVDSLKGGAGNDTINAVVQANGLTGSTVSPGDTVVGGAGTDTFNLSVAGDGGGAGYTLQAVNLSAVENVMVTNYDTNATNTTIDTSLMSGVEKVGLFASSATGDTIFSNMTAVTDAQMSNGSGDLTLTYIAGTTGTADTQNLAISATAAGTFNANGVETVAVTGSLAANTLTNIAGSSLTKLTIGGDQNFTMTGANATATIDASANTGKTSLLLGAASHIVTLGAGDDTLDVGATMNALDKMQGGAGTDTIKITAAGTVNGGTTSPTTSEFVQSGGFEVIDFASTADAATINVKDIAGIETVKLAANALTVVLDANASDTAKATNSTAIGFTLNGTAYTTAATDGSATSGESAVLLKAKIDADVPNMTAVVTGATIVITQASSATSERVDFALTSGHTTEDSQGYSDVTVSGVTTQAVDVYTADTATVRLVDPSGDSDSLTVNLKSMLADRSAVQTVTVLDVADTIETLTLNATGMKTQTATAAVGKTLSTLTADNSTTTLNIAGTDNLTITNLTAGKLATIAAGTHTGDLSLPGTASLAQTITTGSGNDTLIMAGNLTATDVIDLGGNRTNLNLSAGVDTLTASGNIGTSVSAAALQVSNVEAFQLTNGGVASTFIDGSKLANVGQIALSSAGTGAFTFSEMGAGVKLGAGITDDELDAAVTWTLADATGTADVLTVDYADTLNAGSSLALTTVGIESLDIVAEQAGTNTATLVNTTMTAPTINITKGVAGSTVALGTLNKATTTLNAGTAKSLVTMAASTGVGMTVSGPGAAIQTYTLSTKADNVTLTGDIGAVIHVINGGVTASAAAADTFNARINSLSTDLTSVSAFEVVNLTLKDATATGFDDATKNDGIENATVVNILGGNSNSSFLVDATAKFDRDKTSAATAQTIDASTTSAPVTLNFGTDDLDIFTTVKGGSASTDSVTTTISAAASTTVGNNPTMSGVESLTIASTNSDTDAVINLGSATGLGLVVASFTTAGGADQIEIDSLAAGIPVRVSGTNAADNLDVGVAGVTGSADALSITSIANNAGLNLDAAGIESLTLAQNVNASYDLAGVSPTTLSTGTVTLTGSGNVALTALHTGINVIDGSAMGGTLTVQAGARDTDLYTITGGVNSDTIAMENAGDILTGGSQPTGGSDTLEIEYAAILGGVTIDLSATDQVVTMDGGTNAAVQSGFENVNVINFTNFGAVITGSDGVNVITGTILADRISAGKGNDTINVTLTNDANSDQTNGGAGADTLAIVGDFVPVADGNITGVETITSSSTSTITLANQTEGFTVTGAANVQTITGGLGNDKFTGGAGSDIYIRTAHATGGIDDYADYTTGADIMQFTKSGQFALDSADADVKDTNEYVEVTNAAGDLSGSVHADNDVIVLTNAAGFDGVAEVMTSIDGKAIADVIVVFYNTETSLVTMAYDNDGNDSTAATIVGTFSGVAASGIAAAFANTDFVLI